jgi:tetratricopeptide (TPR) repeat protein
LLADVTQGDVNARRELGNLNVSYGEALRKSGDLRAAVDAYQAAVAVHNGLVKEAPTNRESKRDLGIGYIHLAYGYQDAGRFPDALASVRRARDILESLVTASNSQSQRDVDVARGVMADELRKLGDLRGALAIEKLLLAADELAAGADPRNHLRRRDVYVDYYKVSRLQLDIGEAHAALASALHCLQLIQADDKASPGNAGTRDDLATIYFQLSRNLRAMGDSRGALDYARRAMRIAEISVRLTPMHFAARDDLSEDAMTVSDLQLALGDERRAIDGYLRAATDSEFIVHADPKQTDWRITLAQLYERLGAVAARSRVAWPKDQFTNRQDRARNFLQKSVSLWGALRKENAIAAEYADESAKAAKELQALETHGAQMH